MLLGESQRIYLLGRAPLGIEKANKQYSIDYSLSSKVIRRYMHGGVNDESTCSFMLAMGHCRRQW
jgi:hypothetical protein